MTNLLIFVESARFVKPMRLRSIPSCGDLSAIALSPSGICGIRVTKRERESIFRELNRLLPVSKEIE